MTEVGTGEAGESGEGAGESSDLEGRAAAAAAALTERPSLGQRLLYKFCRNALVYLCWLYWRTRVTGKEHVPKQGGFVLAPVHRSNIDTPLVAAVTKRRLRYMGKDAMWKSRPVGWLFTALGSFPVKRGTADRVALRMCLNVLNAGEVLVVFPEGTRRSGPVVTDISEGAAYLAIRAGVPILPVGIGGSERAMTKGSWVIRPVKTHLVIGPPIHPPASGGKRAPRRVVHELTEQLRAELQRLFDEASAIASN